MKDQRETEPKAGVPGKKSNIQQKKITGRSTFSLLIVMAGFGMMSFVQDENTVHADANVNTGTALVYTHTGNCCKAETVKPDKTTICPKKEATGLAEAIIQTHKADNEAQFNFSMSVLYPEAGIAAAADAQMIRTFGEDLLQQSTRLAIAGADAEAQNKFRDENFAITMQYAAADADAGMLKMFEEANFPYITYPSAAAIASADAEV